MSIENGREIFYFVFIEKILRESSNFGHNSFLGQQAQQAQFNFHLKS